MIKTRNTIIALTVSMLLSSCAAEQEVTEADQVILDCHAAMASIRLFKPVLDGTQKSVTSPEVASRIAADSADRVKAAFPDSNAHWEAYRLVRTEVFKTISTEQITKGLAVFDQYKDDIQPCKDDYPS